MIDGKRELAFELQNSGVYEKRSKSLKLSYNEYLKHFFYYYYCTRFKRNNILTTEKLISRTPQMYFQAS